MAGDPSTSSSGRRSVAAELASQMDILTRRRREAEASLQAAEDAADDEAISQANAELDTVLSEMETLRSGGEGDRELDRGSAGDFNRDGMGDLGFNRDRTGDLDEVQVLYEQQNATARDVSKTSQDVSTMQTQIADLLQLVGSLKRRRVDDEGESIATLFPPIEAQFAFVDAKHLESALAGKLAPDLLAQFIPPTHAFHQKVTELDPVSFVPEGAEAFRAIRPKKSEADMVRRFVAAIPSISVFCVAWQNLTTVMIHGLHDPPAGVALGRAMGQYMQWMSDYSALYTWESVVRYHIRFSTPHFAVGASDPAIWAGRPDPRDLALLEKVDKRPANPSASSTRQRRPNSRQPAASKSAAAGSSSGPGACYNNQRIGRTDFPRSS